MSKFTWEFYCVVANHEGLYQQYEDDAANYDSTHRLIGTMRGISAIALEDYYKQFKGIDLTKKSVEEFISILKALTAQDAYTIYKALFWDKINGDYFLNDSIAHILFDWYIASAYKGLQWAQGCLKTIGIDVTVDYQLTKDEVQMINSYMPQKDLFDFIKSERLKYVEWLCQQNPKLLQFKSNWVNRINSYQYSD